MKFGFAVMIVACGLMNAQTWDTSGNGMLNGNYYFREVILTSQEAVSFYGNIVFNGNGGYTINAQEFYCSSQCQNPFPYQASGTYSIAGSGFGFIIDQSIGIVTIGSVGANGVFVGSSTEGGIWQMFVAAPISSQGTGTLSGNYSLSYLTPNLFSQTGVAFDALLQMSPNGAGNIGNVNVSAYSTSATPLTQTITGVKYFVSNNAFVVTFPNSNSNLLVGQEYLYSTPDGSFVFGGSPEDFDMIVGVRAPASGSTTFSGLYYQAGMDYDNTVGSLDAYYGSFTAANGSIVEHERLQDGSATGGYSYVFNGAYPTSFSGTYTDALQQRQFIVSGGVRIGIGTGAYPALAVAVQAPNPTPSSGIYLNPLSAVNTANNAPFTLGIASGELITLTGTGLGPSALAVATTVPLPTTLAGVQVLINGKPAPLYTASSTQILVQVPYQTTASPTQIQVSYKGNTSNMISVFANSAVPGVFTNSMRHANGTLVTSTNPAKVGETISVYLTGLGDVSPVVVDGGAGSAVSPSTPVNPFFVYIGGTVVTPAYLGLAPGLPSLYLMKVQIPTGLANGNVLLELAGPDTSSSLATIPVTGGSNVTLQQRTTMSHKPARKFIPLRPTPRNRSSQPE